MSSWQVAQVSDPTKSAGSGLVVFLGGLICCLSAPAALTRTAFQKQNSDRTSATQKNIRLICFSRKEVKKQLSLLVQAACASKLASTRKDKRVLRGLFVIPVTACEGRHYQQISVYDMRHSLFRWPLSLL